MKSRIVSLVIFLVVVSNLKAVGFLVEDTTAYPFIADSLVSLRMPDSVDYGRRDIFLKKLDSLVLCEGGRMSILHIGGSHVQADAFPNRVRRHLDSINGRLQPSRGVIFPYRAAKTNNPRNYKICSQGEWQVSRNTKRERCANLGVMGMAITTTDPSAEITVQLNPDSTKRWFFNRLTLLGYGDSLAVPILIEADGSFRLPIRDEEAKTFTYEFREPQDSFRLRIVQADSIPQKFHLRGFLLENEEDGVVYHSIGVNGASVPSYLSCEDFAEELSLIKPDAVIFAIGINDAIPTNFSEERFVANYDSLISEIEKVSPDCFYIFITNNDSYRKIRRNRRTRYVVNDNGVKAQNAFKTLAKKHDGAYWDQFAWMGGLKSMAEWQKYGLAQKDKVHFTKKGYELIGDKFYNALIQFYLDTIE